MKTEKESETEYTAGKTLPENVPFGTTLSYAALARRVGVPKAVRVVANANGANSVSIFAPCHRIIGGDRSLTGYGGGLPAKKYLLELEADIRPTL